MALSLPVEESQNTPPSLLKISIYNHKQQYSNQQQLGVLFTECHVLISILISSLSAAQ